MTFHLETYRLMHVAILYVTYSWRLVMAQGCYIYAYALSYDILIIVLAAYTCTEASQLIT